MFCESSLELVHYGNNKKQERIYIGSIELEKSLNYFKVVKPVRKAKELKIDKQEDLILTNSLDSFNCRLIERLIKRI